MFGLPQSHHRPRNVRLDTLVRLRWLAVFGQAVAVLVVHFGLEFDVPIWPCFGSHRADQSALDKYAMSVTLPEDRQADPRTEMTPMRDWPM